MDRFPRRLPLPYPRASDEGVGSPARMHEPLHTGQLHDVFHANRDGTSEYMAG
jgi:hypothetical protein